MPQEDRDELRKMFAEQDRALEEKIETLDTCAAVAALFAQLACEPEIVK